MIKYALSTVMRDMLPANTRTYVSRSSGMLARPAAVVSVPSYSCRSHHGPAQLSRPIPLLRRSTAMAAMIPDDFDAMVIARKAFSSLQQPNSHPLASSSDQDSSNTSPASSVSSMDMSDSSSTSEALAGMSIEDIKAHKRAAVQQAFLNDSLGFGFSAGGLVFPYYVGLVSALVQRGVLTRPAQLAGSSAGSLIAASYNAGLDMATVEKSLIEFGENCLQNGTRYRLGPLLRDFLEQYLPPDAHELCSGNTHVAVTRLLPYWRTKIISHFYSREDLIQALLTSCHIPWYFDGRWMTKFRGHYCVDGGVLAFIPNVPQVDYTVKVMCFPSSHLERLKATTRSSRRLKRFHDFLDIDITMDTYEHWPYDLQQILKWALVASAKETSSLLIEKGKKDATLWFEDMQLEPLVQQKQQQLLAAQEPQLQGRRDNEIGWGSCGGVARTGEERALDAAAAADWTDPESSKKRKVEAERVQDATQWVEAVAVPASTADDDGNAGVEDVASVVGVDGKVAEHAVDALRVGESTRKKHKVEQVAASAAAAAGQVKDKLQEAVVGDREERESSNRA